MNVLRNFFYPRLQPCVVSPIAKATGRTTGSDSDGRARQAAVIPLPKPEIEKELRFAKRTVNGLVVVLARPRLRIAPKIDADEPSARSARAICPASRAIIHLLPGNEHTTRTHGAVKIRFYRGLRGVLLIGRLSGCNRDPKCGVDRW